MAMHSDKRSINRLALLLVLVVVAGLFGAAFYRLKIEADIVSALPGNDPVLRDGREIMRQHPFQDRVVIDVSLDAADALILIAGARVIEERLEASGLFQTVGLSQEAGAVPELIDHITASLPQLFSAKDLAESVAPLLTPERIRAKLAATLAQLGQMEGIGQAHWIEKDPLGLGGLVLARLRNLSPSMGARIEGGYLLAADNRHLLMVAKPRGSSTDTAFSRAVMGLVTDLENSPELATAGRGHRFTLTPSGAFRAALDNETAAKGDVQRLVLFVSLGIALLLFFCFNRPLLGFFAFLPAIAGSAAALFVYSFFHRSIFLMTLGFGGAIVSITVDHGIAYLLFLDQPRETRGGEVAREVRPVGLLATLTSMGAFLALLAGGFPILSQIGLFAALGIGCSFAFVHGIFPLIFPVVPPAPAGRHLRWRRPIERGFGTKGKSLASAAVVFCLAMLWFARPEFSMDLKAMNTVGPETRAAEKLVSDVWGNLFSRTFLMAEADSPEALQGISDWLLDRLEQARRGGVIGPFFVPSQLFPGPDRSASNLAAWEAFWSPERVAKTTAALRTAGTEIGFAAGAFDRFLGHLGDPQNPAPAGIPHRFFGLLGVSALTDGDLSEAPRGTWRFFTALTPGPAYPGSGFVSACRAMGVRVFDPNEYATRLGKVLGDTFVRMIMIIGVGVAVLLVVFYRSWKLTVLSLLPVAFSFICTLGTLHLAGHPLDLAALMLSILVIGMGVDYSLFLVRAYQRYGNGSDPRVGLIRVTVFLAAASTLIGFGAMNFARHLLLRSAGFTCFFGILYAYLGAVFLLPPILDRLAASGSTGVGTRDGASMGKSG